MSLYDEDDDDSGSNSKYRGNSTENSVNVSSSLWRPPIRSIMKPCLEALIRYKMISNGDKVLVCVSGGKDSLSLLHTLRQYKLQSHRFGIEFELGAMTVDPGSSSYDPSPLIPFVFIQLFAETIATLTNCIFFFQVYESARYSVLLRETMWVILTFLWINIYWRVLLFLRYHQSSDGYGGYWFHL